MSQLTLIIVSAFFMAMPAKADLSVDSNVQCWADGHKYRVQFTSIVENRVDSRLAINFAANAQGDRAVLRQFIGHVAIERFVEGRGSMASASYYGHFKGSEHVSVLRPAARKYTDDKYFAFDDFDSTASLSWDGGRFFGTLVISKDVLKKEAGEFSAHYVLQAGANTGGTIDYTCVRQN
jgi:hypothetical protein